MQNRGNGRYGLSAVSQLEHALQSAALAAERNLGDEIVVAALFHDLGHLLVGRDVDLASQGIDDVHEETGARTLERLFGCGVAEPVRLHVAAKRYLCGVNPAYYDKLSEDSRQSLALQGGPMTAGEIAAFDRLRAPRGGPRAAPDRRRGQGRRPRNAGARQLPRGCQAHERRA